MTLFAARRIDKFKTISNGFIDKVKGRNPNARDGDRRNAIPGYALTITCPHLAKCLADLAAKNRAALVPYYLKAWQAIPR